MLFSLIMILIITGYIYSLVLQQKGADGTNVRIELEKEQLTKLKEISKKDFRDVEHTILMLVDDYIQYFEEK